LGETADFDGRETIGALTVCAVATAKVAVTRTRLPKRTIVFRESRGIGRTMASSRGKGEFGAV
jgi:hypothetical protein